MWAYLAAYKAPHDDADAQEQRVHIDYPIVADRVLGLGELPSVRLQRAFARQGQRGPEWRAARPRARVGALELVPGSARDPAVHPRAPARALHAGRRDDLRGLQPRRRASTGSCPPRRPGMRRWRASRALRAIARRAPDDGRVRRVLLERRLGLALQCVRR